MSNAWEENPHKNDPLMRYHRELEKVKDDARSLVLVTNGFFELLIQSLIKAKCKNAKRITEDNRTYPYSAKLLILNEIGILSDQFYATFDKFRRIRNDAAHNPFFQVTTESLQSLNEIKDSNLLNPENLYDLCIMLEAALWNSHISVFAPEFFPGEAKN